ncbi:polysaccharide deacetylase family protein [Winogradskyella echinorum]|uniref:Polysaccharide deacetylase family protein n=1 Tax=Winogradskyella echinorum TaxID=538189 RepID=A0ABR6Y021_9FLAO|nr:polysaccharide deacetylase family protein [Winogradskyella echinorum]MBC3846102.1 polysaccharide deacetylase family protein [Winogradskyella echinorum]MBC5750450.1 polysaccharide deacetylase family protein [Winogradskyella echinorum]
MKIIPAKTPGFVKTLFPNFIWNIYTNEKELYLTFDDGPTPEITNWVLDTLNQYNAKATFFCIGNNIERNIEIFQNILAGGHAIGNHTYNHLKGWKTKTKDYVGDVELTDSVIQFQIQNSNFSNLYQQRSTNLFRPPYGKFKTKQSKKLQKLDYKIVLWDVLSYDWDKSVNEGTCYNNVISAAKEGSIIVFHDSVKASRNLKYVLPKVLDYYTEKGYVFKALS